jgi:uncharacterized protein YacL
VPKQWWIFLWVMIGILSSYTAIQVIFPLLKWRGILLAIVIGGLLGWLFQKTLVSLILDLLKKVTAQGLLIYGLGVLFGLLAITLITVIVGPFMAIIPFQNRFLATGLFSVFIISGIIFVISIKFKELSYLFYNINSQSSTKTTSGKSQFKILDTSAIIDGRIADLCQTGFLEGVLIIPNFVLNELQKIADSADSLRRNRGRRGLDLLNKIQKENHVTIRIFDRDYEELTDVDTKLLKLAREIEAKVVTNDFNLNKVAELYGVQVLNINDLSNAIKPAVLPGEEMLVRILRDGKEYGQGIGYLEDGTMIVVEGGKSFIGIDLEVLVTSVLQTSAGRMIFAKPKEYLIVKETS